MQCPAVYAMIYVFPCSEYCSVVQKWFRWENSYKGVIYDWFNYAHRCMYCCLFSFVRALNASVTCVKASTLGCSNTQLSSLTDSDQFIQVITAYQHSCADVVSEVLCDAAAESTAAAGCDEDALDECDSYPVSFSCGSVALSPLVICVFTTPTLFVSRLLHLVKPFHWKRKLLRTGVYSLTGQYQTFAFCLLHIIHNREEKLD